MRRRSLRLSAGFALLVMGGCSFQYHDLSQGRVQQSAFRFNWGKPRQGMYRCLSAVPGTPVVQFAPGATHVIGYTRNVVAFWGLQEGNQFSVLYYNGMLGWVPGDKLSPFHGSRPGETCVIPGVDRLQRPMFVIR